MKGGGQLYGPWKIWELLGYGRDMNNIQRQLEEKINKMTKYNSNIVILEAANDKIIEQEKVIKELQAKIKKLKLKQHPGFLALRHSPSS